MVTRRPVELGKSFGERLFMAANVTFLLLLSFATLYPFIHVTALSFSTQSEAVRPGLHLFPLETDTSSFSYIFSSGTIWVAYFNTLHRTIIGTALGLLTTILGAYALSKPYLPLRKTLFVFVLFTMYFNGGIITRFLLIRSLGLINSRWAMILPWLSAGFNLIIIKNFFLSIPDSLEESAKMDGASNWVVLFRIVIPLSKPAIATIAMFIAVFHWNAYFDNLMYVNTRDLYVLQRFIRNLVVENDLSSMDMDDAPAFNPESLKAATILVATIPILLIYPFAQKYFIKGVMIGAVKG